MVAAEPSPQPLRKTKWHFPFPSVGNVNSLTEATYVIKMCQIEIAYTESDSTKFEIWDLGDCGVMELGLSCLHL